MKFLYKNINQKESSITPEKYFYNKRKFLKTFGVLGLSSILSSKISLSIANQILNVKKNINCAVATENLPCPIKILNAPLKREKVGGSLGSR